MAFPNDTTGMLRGAVVLSLGLFLIGTAGSTNLTTIVIGLILVIIGTLIFAQ